MKHPARGFTVRSWLGRGLAAALLTQSALSCPAATYYQVGNHNGSGSWDILTHWNTATDSTGTSPATITGADDYIANKNAWYLRTPTTASTFGGKSLTIGPSGHHLVVKSWTATSTVPTLDTLGAAKVISGGTNSNLAVSSWLNQSGTTTITNHSQASALFPLAIGTLTGSGNFNLTSGSTTGLLKLTITDANDYIGTITLASGRLEFMNAISSAGAFVVTIPADVILNYPVTFTGLTVAGIVKPPGTYAATSLGFAGTGSVTVRTSQTWYLTVSQAGSQNWTEAYLSYWNSLATGTGISPTSINVHDHYVNRGAARQLRTPTSASTFGGASLSLANTAQLVVKTPAAAVSTIPVFYTSATPTILNGWGNVRQDLAIGDWEITSGTTKISASAGRGLAFNIGYLSGAGTLQTHNGGAFYLNMADGTGYTGTLDHASGSLAFESIFATRGAFNVGATSTVTLDRAAYFTSFNIAGVAQPAGIQTYAALNAAHPARFPAGSASGLVAVYTPDSAGPAHMFGVNLAGGEFGSSNIPGSHGTHYIYPSATEFDYFHAKSLNLIRVPFLWERLQQTLGGPLQSAELARLDTVVNYAATRGMKVVLDMHNYARRKDAGVSYLIGTGPVSLAHFGDVWRRIADHYKGNSAIYGYGIMNEPHGTSGTWPAMAQTAVDAIRTVDLNTYVIVGGDTWSNAAGWRSKNPNLDTRDPVGRLIYEAHCYFDSDNSGTYDQTYDGEGAYPMIGVDRVTEFVEWLDERGAKGFIGEYGVPGNDPRWLTVLDNFLAYLDANEVSGTYWAGGAWWGTYPLSVEPTSNFTVDKPQMSILQNYP